MTMPATDRSYAPGTPYADSYDHLEDELRRVDALLRLRVAELRDEWRTRPEAVGQALYVGHDEVDWLLSGDPGAEPLGHRGEGRSRLLADVHDVGRQIEGRVAATLERGIPLTLPGLGRAFGLSPFEIQAVVVCLAPELRRVYDRLYAYVQDDITRKRPSVDLVLELLCATDVERWEARAAFGPQAPLFRAGILEIVDDPHSPSGSSCLSRFLKIDPRILHFLLGHLVVDPRLEGLVDLHREPDGPRDGTTVPDVSRTLRSYAIRNFTGPTAAGRRTVLHLRGPAGVGKRDLALAVSGSLDRPMLSLDAARLVMRDDPVLLLRLAFRESLLIQAPLYVSGVDALLRDDDRASETREALARIVSEWGWRVFLGGEKAWSHPEMFEDSLFHSVALPLPDHPARAEEWRRWLEELLPDADAVALSRRLAPRFRITGGRIREAVRTVANEREVHDREDNATFADLADACRTRAHHGLDALAKKVDPHFGWDDLVLPDDQLTQLREMCNQLRLAHQVYTRWGFGGKIPRGRGLSSLFTGPPGTGKTMAAEVIAGDLRLDLYKIDLASVVSKYIGETERNLARIFDEAESSHAILFFDEADALFGKRTEISDAHDRYANIETSYLLQRMEDYEGVVILASNLRENMDDAFLRRLRFIVQFPFPEARSRLEIWKTHFPPEAPVGEDVDCELLAERIPVAGGNIKNIVLSAAFFAASDGGVIGMEHFAQGTRREFEKIGKLWDDRALARSDR